MGANRIEGMGRSDLIRENVALQEMLQALVKEADLMLAGGEEIIRQAEQCGECGLGGEGPLKDVLARARTMLQSF
jgi:hypothetical protein